MKDRLKRDATFESCGNEVSNPFCAKRPKWRIQAKGLGRLFFVRCLIVTAVVVTVGAGLHGADRIDSPGNGVSAQPESSAGLVGSAEAGEAKDASDSPELTPTRLPPPRSLTFYRSPATWLAPADRLQSEARSTSSPGSDDRDRIAKKVEPKRQGGEPEAVPLPDPASDALPDTAVGGATDASLPGPGWPMEVGDVPPQPWTAEGAALGGYGSWVTQRAGAQVSTRPELSPWYATASTLFFDVMSDEDTRLVQHDSDARTTSLWASKVDPAASMAIELSAGRYLKAGLYSIGATYFRFDPDGRRVEISPASPGAYHSGISSWADIVIDPSGGASPAGAANGGSDTVDAYFDAAADYRATRDLDFQSFEINFTAFGLMGAQRAAGRGRGTGGFLSSFNSFCRRLGLFGSDGYGCSVDHCAMAGCRPKFGFGGAGGALVRPRVTCVQVVSAHGFRWFEIEDSFGFDANVDGSPGYQGTDVFADAETSNNLFGYQFSGRLIWCFCNRIYASVGGKFGLYGNSVETRVRIRSASNFGYYSDVPSQSIDVEAEETVFSTLGELDLGIGYRISHAWTVRGGYRVLSATGVATSLGVLTTDVRSVSPTSRVHVSESLVLHGGYLGTEYNW